MSGAERAIARRGLPSRRNRVERASRFRTTRPSLMPLRAAIVPVTPFQQNCSLLWCAASNRAAIVDPGGDLPRILAAIEKTGVTPEKILLTHGHIEHAGGAAELKERLGVPVEGPHRDDKFLLDKLVESGRKYGMVEARNVAPDRWLDEGDAVTVGELATSCTARGTRPAASSSSRAASPSPSSATCCSAVPSVAPTSSAAITPPSSRRSR